MPGRIEAFLTVHLRILFFGPACSATQHESAKRQILRFSGTLSFSVKDWSLDLVRKLAEQAQNFFPRRIAQKDESLLFYIPTEDILRSSFSLERA
jgi:cystathionine gamma-synthase